MLKSPNSTPENHAQRQPQNFIAPPFTRINIKHSWNRSPITIQISTTVLMPQSIQDNLSLCSVSSSDRPFLFVYNQPILITWYLSNRALFLDFGRAKCKQSVYLQILDNCLYGKDYKVLHIIKRI